MLLEKLRELILQDKNHELEEGYIHFLGRDFVRVTKHSGTRTVILDNEKIQELLEKNGRRYLEAHTHSRGDGHESDMAKPSRKDIEDFLFNDNSWGMIVIQKYYKTGMPEGYFFLGKTQETEKYLKEMPNRKIRKFRLDLRRISRGKEKSCSVLEKFAEKYALRLRVIPESGYKFCRYCFTFSSTQRKVAS